MQSVVEGHPPQRLPPGDVHTMLLQHRRDDAVRQAAASLHAAIRKYQQSVQPLLTLRNRELPVKASTSAFVMRLADDVAQCALDCVDVLRSEGEIRSAKRQKELCQMLSITSTTHAGNTDAPLELHFLRDLKTRLEASVECSAGDERGSLHAKRDDDDDGAQLPVVVPVRVIEAVARTLWLHRRCADAASILWSEAVEALLVMDAGMGPDETSILCARNVARSAILFAGTGNNASERAVVGDHTLTKGQRVLIDALELWCVCQGAGDVATTLNDETVGALMACALPASVWGPLKVKLQSRADVARPLQLSTVATGPSTCPPTTVTVVPSAVSPERLRRRAAFKATSSPVVVPTTSEKLGPTVHRSAAPLSPTAVSTMAAASPSQTANSTSSAVKWLLDGVADGWRHAAGALQRPYAMVAIALLIVQLLALWYLRVARNGSVAGARPRRALDL